MSGRTVYTYVGNDPLDKTDPTGQFEWPWHFVITLIAGIKEHQGFWHSLGLAWHTANVDFRHGSQGTDAAHTNMHAMGGTVPGPPKPDGTATTTTQTPAEAQAGTSATVADAMKSGDTAVALHAAEDDAVPLHHDHVWKGVDGSFVKHFLGDVFPSASTVRDALDNAKQVLQGQNPVQGPDQ